MVPSGGPGTQIIMLPTLNWVRKAHHRKDLDYFCGDYKFLSSWKESVFINVVAFLPPRYIKRLPLFLFDKRTKLDKMAEQLEEKVKNEH